jgi:tRNA(Ile)-lysidine synthase
MALLDLFCRTRETMALSLSVAHVHHGLRGLSADEDEVFVRSHCGNRGIPFFFRRVDVPGFANSEKRSIEEAGRILRFRFFRELLADPGFEKIALGHHADDHAETVLINLIRGSGLRGARGILAANGPVIHPMLFASRGEIVSYAAFRNIAYRTDPSNQERHYRRNRIRQDIMLPLKREFGLGIVRKIGHFGEIAAEALEFIDHEAGPAFERSTSRGLHGEILLDIFPLLSYFRTIQKAVLFRIFRELLGEDASLTADEYRRILVLAENARSGRRLKVSGVVHVVRSGTHIVFFRDLTVQAESIPVSPGEWIRLDGQSRIRVEIRSRADFPQNPTHAHPFTEYLDYDKIRFPLVVRHYRAGDRFVPLGMRGPKKLKRFFIDKKIPNYLRNRIPILWDADGPIWIVGHRIDDRVKITQETKTVLKTEAASIHEHQTVTG